MKINLRSDFPLTIQGLPVLWGWVDLAILLLSGGWIALTILIAYKVGDPGLAQLMGMLAVPGVVLFVLMLGMLVDKLYWTEHLAGLEDKDHESKDGTE